MFFTYLYLLRIPTLGGLILAGFGPLALTKGTHHLTTLLEGLFDLNWWLTIAVVTLFTLLAGSACATCAELVLRYGSDRFYVRPLPAWLYQPVFSIFGTPIDRLSLINWAVYGACAYSLLAWLIYGGKGVPLRLERLAGVGIGSAAFFIALMFIIYVRANSPPALSRYLASIFKWTPDGYIQSADSKQLTLKQMEARCDNPVQAQEERLSPART